MVYNPLTDNSCLENNYDGYTASARLGNVHSIIVFTRNVVMYSWRKSIRAIEIFFIVIFLILYALLMFMPYWLFHRSYNRGQFN